MERRPLAMLISFILAGRQYIPPQGSAEWQRLARHNRADSAAQIMFGRR